MTQDEIHKRSYLYPDSLFSISNVYFNFFTLTKYNKGMYPVFPHFSETNDESCSPFQSVPHIKVQESFDSVMIVDEQFR